uniref:Ig-like domain-containing protein n=1 Tax=Macrostomum lignano TaxID=282301 RepID=A0A1I8FA42_9PLAT
AKVCPVTSTENKQAAADVSSAASAPLLLSCLSLSLFADLPGGCHCPGATNGGVTRLGQRVTVQCRPLRPTDIVLVRLLRRPLTGGAEVEVFVSAKRLPRACRPPWKSRRDATFSLQVPGAHLDGPSAGGRVQLLTAMTPAEPRLFANRRAAYRSWISVRRAHLKGAVRTWTGPVTAGSKTMTVYSSVTHSVKIELGSHGAVYGCQLKPHPMFAHLNITYGVKSDPIRVLYTVRRIELQPYRDNYFHGDRIDCLAKGRPAPKIQWTRIRGAGPLQVNGSSLYCSPVPKSLLCVHDHCGRPDHRSAAAASGRRSRRPHQTTDRGISVFLITFGVICGFALIAVVFAYLYSTAFSSSTAYGRLRDNPEDRLRFYGDNGRGQRPAPTATRATRRRGRCESQPRTPH